MYGVRLLGSCVARVVSIFDVGRVPSHGVSYSSQASTRFMDPVREVAASRQSTRQP